MISKTIILCKKVESCYSGMQEALARSARMSRCIFASIVAFQSFLITSAEVFLRGIEAVFGSRFKSGSYNERS